MDVVALGLAKAAIRRSAATQRPRTVQVTTRGCSQYQGMSNGTDTSATSRTMHVATDSAAGIRLMYANVQGNGGNTPLGQFDGPNAITVRAAVEVGGQLYPVYFNGQRSVVLDPGAVVVSDACGAALVEGVTYFVRTFVSVASAGMKWGIGLVTTSANGEGVTVGSDLTAPGSGAVTATSTQVYSPWAILGEPQNGPVPSVCIWGDSLANGSRDSATAPAANNMGYIERACTDAGIGSYKISQPGESAQNFVAVALRRHREIAFTYATDAVCSYGRNDITQGRTLAQVQGDLVTAWTAATRRRCRVWQATITPVTTSTDSWATTAGQTVTSNEPVRVALNTWLRDGAPILNGVAAATGSNAAGTLRAGTVGHPLAGVFEVADLAETARDSGIWKAGYCFDGTHPNATGYAAMAPGIVTSRFAITV